MQEMSIIGVHSVIPPLQPFAGARATEKANGYAFILSEGAVDAFPYSARRLNESQLALHHCDETQIPIAAPGTSSGDLALQAARELLDKYPEIAREHIGLIIHVHSTLDETISGSVAGRIQHELGLRNALPFGVSQQHVCGFFAACDLAMAFFSSGELHGLALIVCSDKWLSPLFRAHGPKIAFGDAGAAALLRSTDGGYPRMVAVTYRSEPELNAAYNGVTMQFDDRHVQTAAKVIAAALTAADLSSRDIGIIIEPTYPPNFLQSVSELSGLQHAQHLPRSQHIGHLSAAAALVGLQKTMTSDLSQADYSLLWQVGMAGDFGACVIKS